MFSFKKPNRNIRRREVESQEDDSDSKETTTGSTTKNPSSRSLSSANKAIKQGLLSFGEEWNEGRYPWCDQNNTSTFEYNSLILCVDEFIL